MAQFHASPAARYDEHIKGSLQKYTVTLQYGRKMYDVVLTSRNPESAEKRAIIMFMVGRRLPINKTSRVKVVAIEAAE